jgi:hypothetical protein
MELKITDMQRDAKTGMVKTISWFAFVKDESLQADDSGVVDVPFKDPSDPDFVSFEDITPQLAGQWVAGVIDLQALQTKLTNQLSELKAPSVVTGTPWQK